MDGYRAFLVARDGEPDLHRHSLSRREEFFARLAREPVRSSIRVDRATYLRNLARARPERGLDARMLWLLATAKANQAERFGVGLAELYGRIGCGGDPVRLHVHLQETYHTRILADVVAIFGLPVFARPPRLVARALVKLLVAAPEDSLLPLTGFGEMAGCTIFRALRDRGVELFAAEPAVAARVRLLYDEILADELCHVGFIAAHLGPTGRALMRGLYRLGALRLAAQMPEVVLLLGRAELRRRVRQPFRLRDMVAEFPERAFAAGHL
jgi:hypothetical protein